MLEQTNLTTPPEMLLYAVSFLTGGMTDTVLRYRY